MKYIVSFTTSPSRIKKIKPMLDSILNQTKKPDLIILNLPKIFHRTKETYIIPEFVSKSVFVNIIDIDYGPATKIVPAIKYLNDENYDKEETRIIYVDDDVRYPDKMIESFDKTIIPRDNSVWAASGFIITEKKNIWIKRHNSNISIAEGYGGVCVKLKMFDDDFISYINKYTSINYLDGRLSDDIILSNYYHKKHNNNIKVVSLPGIYSLCYIWKTRSILNYGFLNDALHLGANVGVSGNNIRYKNVIKFLSRNKELYLKKTTFNRPIQGLIF